MADIRFIGYPCDGRAWRNDAIGGILTVPTRATPMVQVQVSAASPEGGRDYKIIEMSVATWPRLVIGRTFLDAVQQHRTAALSQIVEVSLDVQEVTMHPLTVYDRYHGSYVIPPTDYRIRPELRRARVVVFERDASDGIGDLVVPCAELFRAYFGQIGIIAHLIISGVLVDAAADRIYDSARSSCIDGRAIIHLGKYIPNHAAQIVARIAFSPVANAVALRIIKDTIASQHGDGLFDLVAFPPFLGPTRWKVRGQPIGTHTRPRFLVHQLLRCTAPLPFTSLVSYRDNPGSDGDVDNERDSSPSTSVPVQSRSRVHGALAIPVHQNADPQAHVIPFRDIDTDEEPVTAVVPHEARKYENPTGSTRRRSVVSGPQLESFSSGRGTFGSPHAPIEHEIAPVSRGDGSPGTLAFFDHVLAHIQQLIDKGDSTVTHLEWRTKAMEWLNECWKARWARIYAEAGSRARRVTVAKLVVSGAPYTLLEIERRRPEEDLATIAVDGVPLATQLQSIFFACAKAYGIYDEAMWSALGLDTFSRLSFRHPPLKSPIDAAATYADRIVLRLCGHASGMSDASYAPDNREQDEGPAQDGLAINLTATPGRTHPSR